MDLGVSIFFVMELVDIDIMCRLFFDLIKCFFNCEIVGGIFVLVLCMIFIVFVSFVYGVYVYFEIV